MTTALSAPTLLSRVEEHAGRRPSAHAALFVGDDGSASTLTYAGLVAAARAIASGLSARLRHGDRVLLLLPEGPDFVPAFLGCLWAGTIAVPAYPPLSAQSRQRMDTLRSIARDCTPAAVVSSAAPETLAAIKDAVPELAGAWWASADELRAAPPGDLAALAGEDVAFLQYTSGSTSMPKGVVVPHEALTHNLELMKVAFEHDERMRMACWLPLFHDMGLIGNVLQALWAGGTVLLMEPATFIKRPARWLWMISRHQANTSGAPNFAYDMCVDRIRDDEIEGLDLSRWTVAYSGAEPVRPRTLRAFAERFAPYGFDPVSWYPCYGLAEATLMVTGSRVKAPATELVVDTGALQKGRVVPSGTGTVLVGNGSPRLDRTVLIVDPGTGRVSDPDEVGEIWVGGPRQPTGYWAAPDATERTFGVRPVLGPDEGHMRTGDLGFVHDGELYVTGRLKDVIIVAGRNHYPQDIEATVEQAHDAVKRGCVAAFSVDDGTERVIVVAGVGGGAAGDTPQSARKRAEITRIVRAAVAADHGIPLDDVVLVRRNAVPKTSSGKIQRGAARAAYLNDEYARPAAAGGGDPEERDDK